MSRTVVLALGVLALAILLFVCVSNHAANIQKDIQDQTVQALSSQSTNWIKVTVDGRNVHLSGSAPSEASRQKAVELISTIAGIANIENAITIVQTSKQDIAQTAAVSTISPYTNSFVKNNSAIILNGFAPDKKQHEKLIKLAEDAFGSAQVTDQLELKSGAPQGWYEASKFAITNLALFKNATVTMNNTQFDLSGQVIDSAAKNKLSQRLQNTLLDNYNVTLDLVLPDLADDEVLDLDEPNLALLCTKQFKDQKLSEQKIYFSLNSIEVEQHSDAIFDLFLKFASTCPNSIIEVAGFTDTLGNDAYNLKLSKQRANKVVEILIKKGLRADRLKAIGYGELSPATSASNAQEQAHNRRIEFKYIQKGE